MEIGSVSIGTAPGRVAGLVRPDDDGSSADAVPDAAWHWEHDGSGTRWSFYLRADLREPGTRHQVTAHSFELLWHAVALLPEAGGLPDARCRAVDAWKLVVVLDDADFELPRRLARSALRTATTPPPFPFPT